MNRRDFLVYGSAAVLGRKRLAAAADGWSQVLPATLTRIVPARFPDRDFAVTRYGAAGDGKTDCRAAFAKAIAECNRAGGGRVTVPGGTYRINGPIHLASNFNLHLQESATIVFGTNPADYLPNVLVRWEGTRCYNYSPLVYALREINIAVTGKGTLDGQAQAFWHSWKHLQSPDQEALRQMGADGVSLERRIFGAGHYLRPGLFLPYDCRNVLVW